MKLTLRKANALQNSINDAIKNITFETKVTVNEFEDPEAKIVKAEQAFAENLTRRDALYFAYYEIRKLISMANDGVGISNRLADVAHLDKQIVFFGEMAKSAARVEADVLQGKLDKIRNRKEESVRSLYGREDEVETSIFAKDEVDGFKKMVINFKKTKQKIQDEILELNVRNEIELTEKTVQTLQKEGLI